MKLTPFAVRKYKTFRKQGFVAGKALALARQQDERTRIVEFPLRENVVVKLKLPIGITQKEADRLAAAILTLPLES